MTQATPYTRTTGFADDERNNAGGRSAVRTAQVDAELDAIGSSLNLTIANLTLLQRDDGVMRDGVVPISALGADTLKLLTTGTAVVRGAWVTATAYAIKDLVVQSGNTYICAVAHTSGTFATDLAAIKWVLFQIGANPSAAAIPFSSTANITSTNMQAATVEVDTNARAREAAAAAALADTTDASKNAGSIGFANALSYAAGTLGRWIKDLATSAVKIQQFGGVADGVTDDAAAVTSANAQAVSTREQLLFLGVHHIGSPVTITAPIVDTMAQIFSLTSQVTIDNGQPVRPEWWGIGNENVVHLAGLSLPAKGGTVLLSNATYKKNNHVYNTGAGGKYWSKDNVKFVGAQMPTFTSDCKALTGGTIIQGTWLSFANGCEYRDVGFDVGYTFTQGIGGGVANDAFSATYPSDAIKAANGLVLGLRVHNLVGLCNGPADAFHAVILAEGTSNVEATGHVIGMYGIHGIIIKAAGVRAEQLIAYCNNSDGVIVKTDTQTTAVANDIQIDRIASHNSGPTGFAPYAVGTNVAGSLSAGMRLHAFGGSVGKVQIGSINESNHDLGIDPVFGGAFTIDNVQIGSITTDGNATTGGNWVANAAGNVFKRCQVGQMVNRNAPNGSICVWTTASDIKFGSVTGVNCSNAAVAVSASATPIFDTLIAESCGAAWQITSNGKPRCGKVILTGTTAAYYQSAGSGQVPALSNSWTQVGGGDTFNVLTTGYGIELNGLISPGSSNVPMTLPQWAWPPTEKRFMLQGRAGATQAAVPVVISTAGVVTINDSAGGTANATNYLSLAGIGYSITN